MESEYGSDHRYYYRKKGKLHIKKTGYNLEIVKLFPLTN